MLTLSFQNLVAPQISPFSFGDEPLNRGEVASVTCVVPKGDLPLDIYWTLNSALIVNGELGFTLVRLNKRTSSLNVDSLEAIHRGSFKCIANNSAGYAEYVAILEVNGSSLIIVVDIFLFEFTLSYILFCTLLTHYNPSKFPLKYNPSTSVLSQPIRGR